MCILVARIIVIVIHLREGRFSAFLGRKFLPDVLLEFCEAGAVILPDCPQSPGADSAGSNSIHLFLQLEKQGDTY